MKNKNRVKKIRKLEDLKAWIEARKLAKLIFKLSSKLPAEEKYGLKKHLNENARHIPSNIAEGFGRFYLFDSTQFYRIALGSLNEVKSDVYLCLDRSYFSEGDLKLILPQINLVDRLVHGLIGKADAVKKIANKKS